MCPTLSRRAVRSLTASTGIVIALVTFLDPGNVGAAQKTTGSRVLATIGADPHDPSAVPETIDEASLVPSYGQLPRGTAERAELIEAEVTFRLLRRFMGAHGWGEWLDAALAWELSRSSASEQRSSPDVAYRRRAALRRALEDSGAFAALQGAVPLPGKDTTGSPELETVGANWPEPRIVWSAVCAGIAGKSIGGEDLVAARAFISEIRALPDDIPLRQRVPPFRIPQSLVPASIEIHVEPIRASDSGSFLSAARGERLFWEPVLTDSGLAALRAGSRILDAESAPAGAPCLVEVLARCPVGGCSHEVADGTRRQSVLEREARLEAPKAIRRMLWWSAPVTFSPGLASATRDLQIFMVGRGLPRPEAVQMHLRARAQPSEAVWILEDDQARDRVTGAEVVHDFQDRRTSRACMNGLSREACDEQVLLDTLRDHRNLLAWRAVARAQHIPAADIALDATYTDAAAHISRIREALIARVIRPIPTAASVKQARSENSGGPLRCQLFRRIALSRQGAPSSCAADKVRAQLRETLDSSARKELATACDALTVPEFHWRCVVQSRLGTHWSEVVSCSDSRSLPPDLGSFEFPTRLVGADLVHVPIESVDNCEGLETTITNEAQVRQLARQLDDRRLEPAWRGLAAELDADTNISQLAATQTRRVKPGNEDVALAIKLIGP